MKLHLLSDGFFTLDKSFLVYMKYMGQPYQAALKPLLIKTSKENILIDTGIGELPEKYRKYYSPTRKPEQTIVVGDSTMDMKSAQELNVFAIGTSTGFATPEQLTHAGANCLISSPLDLTELIEKLNQNEATRADTEPRGQK